MELVEERERESMVVVAIAEEDVKVGHFGKMCLKP